MSLQELVKKLGDADQAERMYAAEDIGLANDAAGLPSLVARLKEEPSQMVREAIVAAMTRIEADEVLSHAVELLHSEDAYIRNQMVELLKQRGGVAIPQLLRAMEDPDEDVRKFVLDVAGRISVPEVREIYARALRDPDINVVITAVEHAGTFQTCEFKEEIEGIFARSEQPMLVTAVLETLAVIGDQRSLEVVLRRFPNLGETPELFHYSMIRVIGNLGGWEHLGQLTSALKAPGRRQASQVIDAVTRIHQRLQFRELPADLLAEICQLALNPDRELPRYEALLLLRNFAAHSEVKSVLREAAPMIDDPDLREAIEEAFR